MLPWRVAHEFFLCGLLLKIFCLASASTLFLFSPSISKGHPEGILAPSIPFGLAVDKNIQSLDEGELAPAILVPTGFVPTQEPAEGWLCMGLALCFPYTCGKWPKALCARGWSQLSQHLAVAPALHLFVIRSLVSCGWNTLDSVCVASTGDSPRASKTAVPLHWKWDFSRI